MRRQQPIGMQPAAPIAAYLLPGADGICAAQLSALCACHTMPRPPRTLTYETAGAPGSLVDLLSATIIVCGTSAWIGKYHDRMPVSVMTIRR